MRATSTMVLVTTAMLAAPAGAGAETLRWGAQRDINSLDPYSFGDTFTLAVLNHVYEGLVRYDTKLGIEPALAESWSVGEDGVTWRFKLRQGVKFHDGSDFTADDVLASLARVSHETSPLKGNLPAYKSSAKIDDHTVDIVVNTTYPLLLNDLTNIYFFDSSWLARNNALLPTDAAKNIEGYPTNNANGTGPFRIESRKPEAKTIFTVNPAWWDKPRHNVTRIEFQPITSAATRVAALISGEIDFTNVAPLQDLPRLEGTPNVKVLAATELRTLFFAFNLRDRAVDPAVGSKNPFRDKKVREAMNLAINIDQIQKRTMRGLSRNTGSLVAPAIPGYAPELDKRLPFDADRAKVLLSGAGYPNGFSFKLLCSNDGLVNEEEICQAASSMWSRIGLKPILDVSPSSVMRVKRTAAEFDVVIIGWANEPMIDAYSILVQVFRTKQGTGGVFNFGEWGDSRIDALTDKTATELDRAKRIPMMTEALQIAKDELIYVPLHQQPMAWATSKRVAAMVQLADNKPRLWHTRID